MSLDAFLFGDDSEPEVLTTPQPKVRELPDWQVSQLRKALDKCGVSSMSDRQQLVSELAGRPVASLRELTPAEALLLGERLAARVSPEGGAKGSSWEERDEETWIDRL